MSDRRGATRRRSTWLASSVVSGAAMVWLFATAASGQTAQPPSGEGAALCLGCHERPGIMEILETPHANLDDPNSPASNEQCESCHGPSGTHVNFPMQVGNIRFTKHAKTPVSERNATCLGCHDEGEQAHWATGAHGESLQCGDCHKIHVRKDPSLVRADQANRCASCHEEILPTAPAKSAHPITGPDALVCTECHNPHGPTNLAACTSCHPQDAPTLARQTAKAQDYHARAISQKIDCTACHKGFVHALPLISQITPPGPR